MAIEGKAHMQFGSGDIRSSIGTCNDIAAIAFANGEPRPIGHIGEYKLKISDIAVVMAFTKTESIDVVIEQLTQLKEIMKESENQLSIIEDDVHRRIAKCLFVDNLSAKETADIIGYSERQIYRIQKKLKAILNIKE